MLIARESGPRPLENRVEQRFTLRWTTSEPVEAVETLPRGHDWRRKTALLCPEYGQSPSSLRCCLAEAECQRFVLVGHGAYAADVRRTSHRNRSPAASPSNRPARRSTLTASSVRDTPKTRPSSGSKWRGSLRSYRRVLDELRSGAIQLTGFLLLAPRLTEDNAEALAQPRRGASRAVSSSRFWRGGFRGPTYRPVRNRSGETARRPARPHRLLAPRANDSTPRSKLEPLSAERYLVQFTASAELHAKLERARELLSHSVPSGDLPSSSNVPIDALLERELKRRTGAGKPRKRRAQKPDSRHIPVDVERRVRERDLMIASSRAGRIGSGAAAQSSSGPAHTRGENWVAVADENSTSTTAHRAVCRGMATSLGSGSTATRAGSSTLPGRPRNGPGSLGFVQRRRMPQDARSSPPLSFEPCAE